MRIFMGAKVAKSERPPDLGGLSVGEELQAEPVEA